FIGLWGLRFFIDHETPFQIPREISIALLVFIFTASLSLWTAYSAGAVIKELLKWIQMLVLVVILANSPRWEWAVFGVVLSAALQAVIGIWEFLGGSGAAHLWILDYRFFRAFGTFGQPNPFGGFLGMVLPLAVSVSTGYLWTGYREKQRHHIVTGLIYAVLAGLLLGALIASWSRGAWIGFLGALGVVVWLFPRDRRIGTALIGTGIVTLILLMSLGLLPASLQNRLTGFSQDFIGFHDVRGVVISDENFAVVERLAHWQSAIGMAEASPWLGIGFGNYENAYPDFKLINWQFALGHAHNYYLNLLAETGIIGLLAYLVMWSVIIRCNGQLLQSNDWRIRGTAVGLLGTWTHIALHSLIDKLYVNNLFLHAGVMLGILAFLHRQNRQRTPI
ncbi:MAG TPA: O-antigen ligase family protein, partial [Aggregatilineales bacterium]|nr:O-antigen ligase family protein [Aggregatilineales bacterium]